MPKTITIRLNEEEELMMDKLSKMYNCGISTAIKRLALEKLEDEYDKSIALKFEEDLNSGNIEYIDQKEFDEKFSL